MSRSTKKGPFVHAGLLKKVEAMNASGNKEVIKTWSRTSTIFPQQFMTEEDTYQYISQKIWLDIN